MTQSLQPSPASSGKERILIISLIVLGLILVCFFGFRAFRSHMRIYQHGLEPGVTNAEDIRGWMTIPYIAIAYGVPEEHIFEQLGIPPEGNQDRSLRRLHREYGYRNPGAITEAVQKIIKQYQAEHPPSPEPDRD
ncbi:hypothetical protein ACFLXQ_06575 [Chloroflexota bacterium]